MISQRIDRKKAAKYSVKDSVEYALGITSNKQEFVSAKGVINLVSTETAIQEMQGIATTVSRGEENSTYHYILSWRQNEVPTKEQVIRAVQITQKELGFENSPTLWSIHTDTDSIHAHVIVTAIDMSYYPPKKLANPPKWDYWKRETACRKIEVEQQWEIERTGKNAVVLNDKTVIGRHQIRHPRWQELFGKKKVERQFSTKQRNLEQRINAHTGCRAISEIAKERLRPIFETSQTWNELHKRLAEQGAEIVKKTEKAGCVLFAGTEIKLSTVSNKHSFLKLVQNLGAYEERAPNIKIATVNLEELTKEILESSNKQTAWEEYLKAKKRFYEGKKLDKERIKAEFKKAKIDLRQKQKIERDTLFKAQSWKGRGVELNLQRSILAGKQAQEKAALTVENREKWTKYLERYSGRFPTFKKWARIENLDEEDMGLILRPEKGSTLKSEEYIDIQNYKSILSGHRVLWVQKNRQPDVADFVDYGNKIVLQKELDHGAVLAALQVAQMKWGTIHVSGSKQFKKLCAKVAAEHNIRLANSELQDEMRQEFREAMTIDATESKDNNSISIESYVKANPKNPVIARASIEGLVSNIEGSKITIKQKNGGSITVDTKTWYINPSRQQNRKREAHAKKRYRGRG